MFNLQNTKKIRLVMSFCLMLAAATFGQTLRAQSADKTSSTQKTREAKINSAAENQVENASQLQFPSNDNFAAAQTISGANGAANGVNLGATKETGEPYHAHNAGGKSVWYKYTAPFTGSLILTTEGSSFDTVLGVYYGSTVASAAAIASNDDFAGLAIQSKVTIGVQAGTTYYIAIDGFYGADGDAHLNWTLTNVSANNNFASAQTLTNNNSASGKMTATNINASKEPNEPSHANNFGGKSIWFKWIAPTGLPRSYTFNTRGSNSYPFDSVFVTSLAVYTGQNVSALTNVGFDAGFNTRPSVTFKPIPGAAYYIAVDGYNLNGNVGSGTVQLNWSPTRGTRTMDFDADGKADITVFRPTTGNWYSLDSESGVFRATQWGGAGDKPVYSDRHGSGKPDLAVYRPSSGNWFVKYDSAVSDYMATQWGTSEDIPLPFYLNSVSVTNPAVFRPSNGTWYLYDGLVSTAVQFGQNGDIPVPADYDGDNLSDIAVFRPSNGTWYIRQSSNLQFVSKQFGINGDKPVAADYNNDGLADVAVFRPSNGTWYVLQSGDDKFQAAQFGQNGDQPQPADYDGDGRADFAVFRPSNGTWYLQQTNSGFKAVQFGNNLDTAITTGYQIP